MHAFKMFFAGLKDYSPYLSLNTGEVIIIVFVVNVPFIDMHSNQLLYNYPPKGR